MMDRAACERNTARAAELTAQAKAHTERARQCLVIGQRSTDLTEARGHIDTAFRAMADRSVLLAANKFFHGGK